MFKKLARLGSTAVIALTLGGGALMATTGSVAAAPGVSQACTDFLQSEFYEQFGVSVTHGGCVSYFETYGTSTAAVAAFCKGIVGPPYVGACINDLGHELP